MRTLLSQRPEHHAPSDDAIGLVRLEAVVLACQLIDDLGSRAVVENGELIIPYGAMRALAAKIAVIAENGLDGDAA